MSDLSDNRDNTVFMNMVLPALISVPALVLFAVIVSIICRVTLAKTESSTTGCCVACVLIINVLLLIGIIGFVVYAGLNIMKFGDKSLKNKTNMDHIGYMT